MAGILIESDEEVNELNQILDDTEIDGSIGNFTLNGLLDV